VIIFLNSIKQTDWFSIFLISWHDGKYVVSFSGISTRVVLGVQTTYLSFFFNVIFNDFLRFVTININKSVAFNINQLTKYQNIKM
jgi:hypothetical protein